MTRATKARNKCYVEEFPNHFFDKIKRIQHEQVRQVEEADKTSNCNSFREQFADTKINFVSKPESIPTMSSRSPGRPSVAPSTSKSIAVAGLHFKRPLGKSTRSRGPNSITIATLSEFSLARSTQHTQVHVNKMKPASLTICSSPFSSTARTIHDQSLGHGTNNDSTIRPTTDYFTSRNHTGESLTTFSPSRRLAEEARLLYK